MTAANSTPLTDGASLVLLASEDWAKARGLLEFGRDEKSSAFVFRGTGLTALPEAVSAEDLSENGYAELRTSSTDMDDACLCRYSIVLQAKHCAIVQITPSG